MIKTAFAAAIATATLGLAALPAQAQSVPVAQCDDTGYSISDNETTITMQLEQQGYKVNGVEDWNNCVRAFVVDASGATTMVFFDPATLQQIGGDYTKV